MRETTSWSHLAVNTVRWSARVLGALVAAFSLFMLIAHALGEEESQGLSVADAVGLTALVVMVVALLVGWFLERVAAIMLLVGYAVQAISAGGLVTGPFLLFPILGLMFGFCSWRSRKSARPESDLDGRRLATRAGALLGLMAITVGVFVLLEAIQSREAATMAAETDLTGRWKSENSDTIKVLKQDGDSLSGSSSGRPGGEIIYDFERREDGSFEGVVRYDSPCEYADTGTGETHTTNCSFEDQMTLWLDTPDRIVGEAVHVFPLSRDPTVVRQYCQSGCTEGVEREVNFVWVRQE